MHPIFLLLVKEARHLPMPVQWMPPESWVMMSPMLYGFVALQKSGFGIQRQINLFMRSYPKIIFPNPKPYSVTNADGSVTPLIQLIQISNGLFEFILDTLYHTLMDAAYDNNSESMASSGLIAGVDAPQTSNHAGHSIPPVAVFVVFMNSVNPDKNLCPTGSVRNYFLKKNLSKNLI